MFCKENMKSLTLGAKKKTGRVSVRQAFHNKSTALTLEQLLQLIRTIQHISPQPADFS